MSRVPPSVAAMCLALGVLVSGGCANSSPPPGEACTSVGGICTAGGGCGESLPYPCPGNEFCCKPLSADGGPN
jgi:hypothetical protein